MKVLSNVLTPTGVARMRLFWRYLMLTALPSCCVVAAFGGFEIYAKRAEFSRVATTLQQSEANRVVRAVSDFLATSNASLQMLSALPWLDFVDRDAAARYEFQRVLRGQSSVVSIAMYSADLRESLFVGRFSIDRIGAKTPAPPLVRDLKTKSRGSLGYISGTDLDAEATALMAAPAVSSDEYLVLELNLSGITRLLETLRIGRTGIATLVAEDGSVIAHSDRLIALKKGKRSDALTMRQILRTSQAEFLTTQGRNQAVDRGMLITAALVPDTEWTLVVEQTLDEVEAPVRATVTRTLLALAFGVLASVVASAFLARQFTRPVNDLLEGASKVARGDLDTRVSVRESTEFAEVAQRFNEMTEKLGASYASLEMRVQEKTRDLANANAALEIVSQHKSDFLAHMSHELRTPLNAVIGFSEMLKAQYFGPLNDKQAEYVRDINASGQHLLSLINDILDLAKVEAGRMELVRSDVHLPSLVESCCSLVSERFARKSQTLEAVVDPAVSFWSLDERKVKQCVLNLLSNANKFTPEGGRVSLSVAIEVGALVLRVTDTGVGIAPDAVSQLFTEFYQVAPSSAAAGGAVAAQSTEAREGTGLGLALTKKFVELHGGTVEVASEVGKGSTFTLHFPAVATADAETAVVS